MHYGYLHKVEEFGANGNGLAARAEKWGGVEKDDSGDAEDDGEHEPDDEEIDENDPLFQAVIKITNGDKKRAMKMLENPDELMKYPLIDAPKDYVRISPTVVPIMQTLKQPLLLQISKQYDMCDFVHTQNKIKCVTKEEHMMKTADQLVTEQAESRE